MKKLLLSAMVLATLVSCGKDNKVSSGAAAAAPAPATNAITVTDQTGIDLGAKIDNYSTHFGLAQVRIDPYTIVTYQQIAASNQPMLFHYTKSNSAANGSNSNCEIKWKIFYVCSYSSSTNIVSGITPSKPAVSSSGVDITAKITELKSYINNSSTLYKIETNGYTYKIRLTDGRQILIDLRYPLQAQPIAVMNAAQSEAEYLYNITF